MRGGDENCRRRFEKDKRDTVHGGAQALEMSIVMVLDEKLFGLAIGNWWKMDG